MANNPELLKMPLARDGQKSTIPETTDASTGLFSQQYGWQSINSLPPQAGGKAVKREDFNGAFNLLGGVAFMAQKGFTFKWSAEQDYYAGCVVIDDTDGLRYECIADVTASNTAPSADATHWQPFKAGTDLDAWFRQTSTVYVVGDLRCYKSLPYGWYLECTTAGTTGGGDITLPSPIAEKDTITDGTVTWTIRKIGSGGDGVPLGTIIAYSANGELPSGYLLCDGSAVSRTMFPDLFAAIGTTWGAGDGSTTFNLPRSEDLVLQGASATNPVGTYKTAGLPNITGYINNASRINTNSTGALYSEAETAQSSWSGSPSTASGIHFDASRSNPIYGASDTVQPNALTTRFIIKAFDGVTPTPSEADISEMLTELTGKADRDLDNLSATGEARFAHVVVDSYYDATTGDWWREYADGWIEQGGHLPDQPGHAIIWGAETQVTLLKPMADSNYTMSLGDYEPDATNSAYGYRLTAKTTTGFIFQCFNEEMISGTLYPFDYLIFGMGAQS